MKILGALYQHTKQLLYADLMQNKRIELDKKRVLCAILLRKKQL